MPMLTEAAAKIAGTIDVFRARASELRQGSGGSALEGQKYRYQTTCQAACLAFKGRGYFELMMSGPLVHVTDPHPY